MAKTQPESFDDREQYRKKLFEDATREGWYLEESELKSRLDKESQTFLEDYTGIPRSEIVPHILDMRPKIFEKCPYPCVGIFLFFHPTIQYSSIYPTILHTLGTTSAPPPLFLDLGCFLGTDLRRVIYDLDHNNPSAKPTFIGSDIQDSQDSGMEFYRDRSKFPAKFIQSDIFDTSSPLMTSYTGKFDIIYNCHFIHNWSQDHQHTAVKTMIELLKPTPGALILGMNVGNEKSFDMDYTDSNGVEKVIPFQSQETMMKLMQDVLVAAGEDSTKWKLHTHFKLGKELFGPKAREARHLPDGSGGLEWVMERI